MWKMLEEYKVEISIVAYVLSFYERDRTYLQRERERERERGRKRERRGEDGYWICIYLVLGG